MTNHEYLPLFPRRTRWLWWPSALAGAVGLAMTYGFAEPPVAEQWTYWILVAAGTLFLLSRVMLLIPPVEISARISRCWLDFAILLAGIVWWALDHRREREVLEIIAAYSAAAGLVAVASSGIRWLTHGPVPEVTPGSVRRLLLSGFFAAVIGGLILSLPQCWARGYPASSESSYAGQFRYELGTHALNCFFTSMSALTGTGLSVQDVGHDYSLGGQIVILLLMQIGGLAILAASTVVGLRLRALLGWQTHQEETTPQGLARAVKFACIGLLALELIGAAAMFFAQPDLFRSSEPLSPKIMGAIFNTVSAVCNVGLTLNGDSLIGARGSATTYAVILPLMVLGGIGGPTLYSLFRKLRERTTALPADVWLTLGVTAALAVIGAGLLYGVESSYDWQLRPPREKTLGSLQWNGTSTAPVGEINFNSDDSERVRSQRMPTMSPGQRFAAALFQSISARTGGLRTARLDEKSLSPASRIVLMAWMLIGGSVGGTAGGVKICVASLLLAAILRPKRYLWRTKTSLDSGAGRQALAAAGTVVASMLLLILLTAFVLTYRQSPSPESCLFESVSACTNSGLTTGLTAQLATEDHLSGSGWLRIATRSTLILAMLFGRALPLGILLRWTAPKESL